MDGWEALADVLQAFLRSVERKVSGSYSCHKKKRELVKSVTTDQN